MLLRHVLVVGGNDPWRADIARFLEQQGHTVTVTHRGSEAVEIVKHRPIGCAIVDVELQDGSGLDLISSLRSVQRRLPVIVTAQVNTRELEARVRQQPVLYYHVKGFAREELLTAVEEAFGIKGGTGMAKKILVIDDDVDFRTAIRAILEASGYEVHEAAGKSEGAERFKAVDPDLVVLDIMMESPTSGFHWLYEARATEQGQRVPVLSVSSIAEKTGMKFMPGEDEQEGNFFPADDFMEKPVEPDELIKRVQALLQGPCA